MPSGGRIGETRRRRLSANSAPVFHIGFGVVHIFPGRYRPHSGLHGVNPELLGVVSTTSGTSLGMLLRARQLETERTEHLERLMNVLSAVSIRLGIAAILSLARFLVLRRHPFPVDPSRFLARVFHDSRPATGCVMCPRKPNVTRHLLLSNTEPAPTRHLRFIYDGAARLQKIAEASERSAVVCPARQRRTWRNASASHKTKGRCVTSRCELGN